MAVLTETLQTATFNTAELEQVKVWLYSGNGTEQTATFTNLQLEEGTIAVSYTHLEVMEYEQKRVEEAKKANKEAFEEELHLLERKQKLGLISEQEYLSLIHI